MGDIAEMMLDGTLCESCGEYIGEPCEFPRMCKGCALALQEAGHEIKRTGLGGYTDLGKQKRKVKCPDCQKKVWEHGLKDHRRGVHGQTENESQF